MSGTQKIDDYVAWCRYKKYGGSTIIKTCDSDTTGAFKVYRHSVLDFICYMIDNCGGEIIGERFLQNTLSDFIKKTTHDTTTT